MSGSEEDSELDDTEPCEPHRPHVLALCGGRFYHCATGEVIEAHSSDGTPASLRFTVNGYGMFIMDGMATALTPRLKYSLFVAEDQTLLRVDDTDEEHKLDDLRFEVTPLYPQFELDGALIRVKVGACACRESALGTSRAFPCFRECVRCRLVIVKPHFQLHVGLYVSPWARLFSCALSSCATHLFALRKCALLAAPQAYKFGAPTDGFQIFFSLREVQDYIGGVNDLARSGFLSSRFDRFSEILVNLMLPSSLLRRPRSRATVGPPNATTQLAQQTVTASFPGLFVVLYVFLCYSDAKQLGVHQRAARLVQWLARRFLQNKSIMIELDDGIRWDNSIAGMSRAAPTINLKINDGLVDLVPALSMERRFPSLGLLPRMPFAPCTS